MPQEINFFELPLEAYHGKLPFPLVSLIKNLTELKANTIENIFVDTKESDSALKLINELSKGKVLNWSKYKDASALAFVFKQYLIKLLLYEPLIPIDCFTVISTMSSMDDLNKKINLCQSILSGLLAFKKARYALIDYIFHFFKFISDDSKTNKMDAEKLSEIFTPIITPQDNVLNISEESANQCVQFLIENYQSIFVGISDSSEQQSYIMTEKEIDSIRIPAIDFNLISIAVNNYKIRKDHVIKFVPNCMFSKAQRFKRPERPPPPKPVTSTQLAVNMFDSTIQRFKDGDNNKKFLLNVRSSVSQMNPVENSKDKAPKRASKINPKPEPKPTANTKLKQEEAPAINTTPIRGSKTTLSKDQFKPPAKKQEISTQLPKNQDNENQRGRAGTTVKNFAKFLNDKGPIGMPIGMPMGMPMGPRRQTTTAPPEEIPSAMGMPMSAPRPKVTKDDEDSPIEKVADNPGQMIHRAPRRGGNRRPPKILSE